MFGSDRCFGSRYPIGNLFSRKTFFKNDTVMQDECPFGSNGCIVKTRGQSTSAT